MTITDLGVPDDYKLYLNDNNLSEFTVARVTQEHRERYIVSTGDKEYDAEITGNLRFTASDREDFPAVGDWVAIRIYEQDLAIIHNILPRKSILERQAVGKFGEKQIISTNIDAALIVQSVDNNFSINRLERYLSVCYSSRIEPVLVISKIDLVTRDHLEKLISELKARDNKIKYLLLSNLTGEGLDQVFSYLNKGQTYCVVGSSGVGKSTLINNLLKRNILRTGEISRSTNKGKHVTDHRELFVLANGAIIIDTPGMRELGITENTEGLKITFEDIFDLASKCKFPDCRHINEKGCAVLEALKKGEIERESFENFQKLQKEQVRFSISTAEKHRREKIFGKMLKNYKKDIKKNEKQE